MKPADLMINGDMLPYTTPHRTYTVRLYRHPANVGHVEVVNNLTNSLERHPAESFGAAQERARGQAVFLRMVESKVRERKI